MSKVTLAQRWPNRTDHLKPTLAQRSHAIWDKTDLSQRHESWRSLASILDYFEFSLVLAVGDACARELIRRRFLPDVCSCCVSQNVSVNVAWREQIVACRDLPINWFLSNVCGLHVTILKKLNTETCVCRTKLDIVKFIFCLKNLVWIHIYFHFNYPFLKLLMSQSKFSGTRKVTVRYH